MYKKLCKISSSKLSNLYHKISSKKLLDNFRFKEKWQEKHTFVKYMENGMS